MHLYLATSHRTCVELPCEKKFEARHRKASVPRFGWTSENQQGFHIIDWGQPDTDLRVFSTDENGIGLWIAPMALTSATPKLESECRWGSANSQHIGYSMNILRLANHRRASDLYVLHLHIVEAITLEPSLHHCRDTLRIRCSRSHG